MAGFTQQIGQPRRLPADHHHTITASQTAFDLGQDRPHLAAVARAGREGVGQRVGLLWRDPAEGAVAQEQGRVDREPLAQHLGGEIGPRKHGGDVTRRVQVSGELFGLTFEIRQRRHQFARVLDDQPGVGGRGEVVDQAAGLAVKVGDEPLQVAAPAPVHQLLDLALKLDPRGRMAGGQVERAQLLGHALADLGQRLAGRPDPGLHDPRDRALGGRVEGAEAVYLIPEELDAQRLAQVGRPDVHDTAPPAKLSRRIHDRRRLVAEAHPRGQHPIQIERLPRPQGPQRRTHLPQGQGHLHERAGRRDDDGGVEM